MYADRRGPRTIKKIMEKKIVSQVGGFIRKPKGDKKVKQKKTRTGWRLSSSKTNIARAMRGRISKILNFSGIRNQNSVTIADLPGPWTVPPKNAPAAALEYVSASQADSNADERSVRRTTRSQNYYGFFEISLIHWSLLHRKDKAEPKM